MPDIRMIQKAGKITFLLVCLFFCTSCQKKQMVFESGTALTAAAEEQMEYDGTQEAAMPQDGEPVLRMVNINTAEKEELMTLPGIGEVRAASIIDYRESMGKFEKIEDIMNVKGIKTGIFSKISSLICVK